MIVSTSFAQNPPLKIGVSRYSPPFVIQGGNNHFYGFDISMMNEICAMIQRDCQYYPMHFDELLDAVVSKKVTVAVSSIIITAERSQIVNFSLPYLPSKSRFLARADLASQKFSWQLLNDKRIGVSRGSVFYAEIQKMNLKNPDIVFYETDEEIIEALNEAKIELTLMDSPTAVYWESHSSGSLKILGEPITYGYGLGIAVNREEGPLLKAINQALLNYQKSHDFTKNYNIYLDELNLDPVSTPNVKILE